MIDVSPKFNTLRYAKARGTLTAGKATVERVKNRTVPKGDVLEVARAAGINAAKRCSDWMIFCHNLPLDWIDLHFELEESAIQVYAEARAVWKTGVEMEALSAVSGALLNMYDMLKPIDDDLEMASIVLVEKRGGKSDFRDHFEPAIRAAVLVISDSTHAGKREDKSGKAITSWLEREPVDVEIYDILPDEPEAIKARIVELVDSSGIQLIITTGGTGLGPRDNTPQSVREIIDIEVPGIVDAIRTHGQTRTPYAMLSRQIVGVRDKSLIICLPGSSNGAKESMQAIFPGVLHAFPMLHGGGHASK